MNGWIGLIEELRLQTKTTNSQDQRSISQLTLDRSIRPPHLAHEAGDSVTLEDRHLRGMIIIVLPLGSSTR